jgi:IclR family KDG regulon transcriptional repressor
MNSVVVGSGSRRRGRPVERVQALGRALDLLERIAEAGTAGIPLKGLSTAAGLHASTAHNLLSSLMAHGYAEQHPETGNYRLGPGALTLANRFLANCDLRELAMPLVRRLHAELDEWVVLSMLRAGQEFTVASIQSTRPLVVNPGGLGTGERTGATSGAGLHCTAVGKVLLSSMDAAELAALLRSRTWPRHTPHTITDPEALHNEVALVRVRGYATNREEHHEGLRAVAAPVHDATARITASLGVAYPTLRTTPEREGEIALAVRRTAAQLSLRLGYAPAAETLASLSQAAGPSGRSREPGAGEVPRALRERIV